MSSLSLQDCGSPVVCVGYLKKCQPWKLQSRFFPSKVGGKPSWLDLANLPSEVKCKNCGKACVLLCQVYAPIESVEECFHRTIFVFVCRDSNCCKVKSNTNFRVFRCQMPRENPYYPFEPPVEQENWRPDVTVEKFYRICALCGMRAPWHCGKCKSVYYCTREHQTLHWKSGHKEKCSAEGGSQGDFSVAQLLLPEFELLTEEEGEDGAGSGREEDGDDGDEGSRLLEYEQLLQRGCAGTFQGDSSVDEDLLQLATSCEDKAFAVYVARVKADPRQVLRYERGGTPLWVSDQGEVQPEDVPPCQLCGSPRRFEFQVLSVLLNHLAVDAMGQSIDWGTLVVYTCSDSCSQGPAYKEEFLYKQDFASFE